MRNKQKKICILTQTDLSNYGNRLQNVALSHFLEKEMQCKVKNLWPIYPYSLKHWLGYCLKAIIFSIKSLIFFRNKYKRLKSFQKFNKLIKKDYCLFFPFKSFQSLNCKYDYFVVGSDQVWNDKFGLPDYFASLCFADSSKRIAYAASAGSFSINNVFFPILSSTLTEFASVSVREEETAISVENITHKKPPILIDPTFLLSAEKWQVICSKHFSAKAKKISEKPYLFVYWLGEQSIEVKNRIQQIAKNRDLCIVSVRTNCVGDKGDFLDCGPYDFVNLIANAAFVVSKSFHGTVFSIIFHKPFISYDAHFEGNHDSRDPRLKNLQSLLGLNKTCFDFFNDNQSNNFDWKSYDLVIESEQSKTKDFFENVLKS